MLSIFHFFLTTNGLAVCVRHLRYRHSRETINDYFSLVHRFVLFHIKLAVRRSWIETWTRVTYTPLKLAMTSPHTVSLSHLHARIYPHTYTHQQVWRTDENILWKRPKAIIETMPIKYSIKCYTHFCVSNDATTISLSNVNTIDRCPRIL